MQSMIVRRAGLGLLASAALVTGVAACGTPAAPPSPPPPPAASTAQHNQQDVMFAQMMIPHHQQAITMSEHELAGGMDPKVKDLAMQIKQAQGPEIAQMQGWLAAWQAPPAMGGMMEHGQPMMGQGGGMMSPQDMSRFQAARGAELDRMFLQMMIQHHQGAVDMARGEIQQGQDPQAKHLAKSIVDSQQAQIGDMQQMLGR